MKDMICSVSKSCDEGTGVAVPGSPSSGSIAICEHLMLN